MLTPHFIKQPLFHHRMRVVTISGSLVRGNGIDTIVSSTLRKIHEMNPQIQLEVICNQEAGIREDGFPTEVNLAVSGHPTLLGYHQLAIVRLSGYIQSEEDTLLHLHHPITTLPLIFKKGKKIATWHGNNNEHWSSLNADSLFSERKLFPVLSFLLPREPSQDLRSISFSYRVYHLLSQALRACNSVPHTLCS